MNPSIHKVRMEGSMSRMEGSMYTNGVLKINPFISISYGQNKLIILHPVTQTFLGLIHAFH